VKIHIVWLGNNPNHRILKCIETVPRVHAAHEVNVWTDSIDNKPSFVELGAQYSNLVIRDTAEIDIQAREVFDVIYRHIDAGHKFPYSVLTLRSDMYRLLILRNEGGLYLDSDIYCLKDLTDLLATDDLYIGEQFHNGSGMGANGVMGTRRAQSPYLAQMIERARSFTNVNDWGFIGPNLVTDFYNSHFNAGGVSLIKSDALFSVSRYDIHRKLERHPFKTVLDYQTTDESFGIHIYEQIYGWTNHHESDFAVTVFPSDIRSFSKPVIRPRLHLFGMPLTITGPTFDYDEITSKIQRFSTMMRGAGYEVYHYGVEGAESGATRQIDIIGKAEWAAKKGLPDYTRDFNQTLAVSVAQHLACHRDILCLPFGKVHQEAVEQLNVQNPVVEIGVCYAPEQTFARFKIFNSYAGYHQFLHTGRGNDSNWVVPSFFDLRQWEVSAKRGSYLLFYGDYTEPNGGEVLDFIARARPGLRILSCGQNASDMAGQRPANVEFMDATRVPSRSALFGNALATVVPARFIGPFESSAVESMLTGTPVLGSDFGAITETVIQGRTGFRCHNLGEYLDGLALIEQGKLSRSEIAEYARKRYDMNVLAWEYDKVFQAIHDSWDYNWDGSWRP
jgi:glycosyltransferase involved in cell wall biosynthesis